MRDPAGLVASPLYPSGLQYEWYAVDRVNCLAVFNTAGCGPVPEVLLIDDEVWERFDAALQSLPEICQAQHGIGRSIDSEFEQIARRGLFAYDWSDVGQPYTDLSEQYELQTRSIPLLTLDDLRLPPDVADWLATVRLDVLFAETQVLGIDDLLNSPFVYSSRFWLTGGFEA